MPTSRRRPTLSDLMIAIAGTAIGLAVWRGILLLPAWRRLPAGMEAFYFRSLALVALLAPLSLTLLVLAFRSPRPRLRRIVTEPAVVVGLAVLFVLTINTLVVVAVMGLVGSIDNFSGGKVLYFCRIVADQTGLAIAISWALLMVSSRVRKPRGWMDLSAAALAICWFLLAMFSMVFTHL